MFQRIVETSRYLYVVLDRDWRISYASSVCYDLLGYTPDEMIGLGPELMHPDDQEIALGALAQLVENANGRLGVGIPLSGRIAAKDGTYRHFEIGAQVQLDDPDVGGVILRLQPIEGQAFTDRALEALVAGTELDEVLSLLAEAVSAEVSPALASIAYDWEDGRFLHLVSAGLPPLLSGGEPVVEGAPWSTVADRSEPYGVPFDALPASLRAAADEAGLRTCWIVPVSVAGQRTASVIVWRPEDDSPWVSHLVALGRVGQLVTLAFQHRHDAALLVHAAMHDGLTGVANRTQFFQRLAEVLAGPAVDMGVLYVDLDDFKPVNDDHGHSTGDEVLRVVTDRIEASVRPGDLVARLGGDEFAVLCVGVRADDELIAIAERLVKTIGEPVTVDGTEVRVAASVGISFSLAGDPDGTLLERADTALRSAKAAGKGQWWLASDPRSQG